ncbi:hypothetical protein ACO2Q7_05840 [Rathayibacter sp. KR2-224]|uniref:hypothetical protein n=1 Tax=Rathayibacter sp. KR2-224 TaxID=3400913 RepID=UPI003C0FF239
MAERGKRRRVQRPGAPGADPTPQSRLPGAGADAAVRASEDTERAWGDRSESNDDLLKRELPPHWGAGGSRG